MSLAVIVDCADRTNYPFVATGLTEQSEAEQLRRMIAKHGATNVRGPFDYTIDEQGYETFTLREWPEAKVG